MMQKHHEAFYKLIDTSQYRSILALNGELPNRSFFAMSNLPIIAADGALNSLNMLDIVPRAVVGDLDTAKPNLLGNTEVVYMLDQNKCDFEKSLDYINKNTLSPSIIVGISGGYIDHILNNMSIFLTSCSLFYAPPIVGYVIKTGEIKVFTLPINTKISLFGLSGARISTNGLKWELENHNLAFSGMNSSFNRTIKDNVLVEAHEGLSLIMVYLEKIEDWGGL